MDNGFSVLMLIFGTALLLSGWDHRFFWAVIAAAPVVAAAMLRAPAPPERHSPSA